MKLPPLKPGITPTLIWLTAAGGLLTTALTILPMLDVAWGAGAVVILGIAWKVVDAKRQQKLPPSQDTDKPAE